MQKASILLQLLLFISAFTAIFFYVRPEFSVVRERQDLLAHYAEAIDEATQLRNIIQDLDNEKSNLPVSGIESVLTYLPLSDLDVVSIKRDLISYIEMTNLSFERIDHFNRAQNVDNYEDVTGDSLNIHVVGDYADIKNFVFLLESNNYPLRITEMSMRREDDGDDIQAVISLLAFRYVGDLKEFNF